MKTFVFVATKTMSGDSFIKCRVYPRLLPTDEIKTHVFPDEVLIRFEYAHTLSF